MEERVRVRFAPSPTGALHLGGVRTALFNYLFARHHGGDFLLRIEDTDSQRFVPGAEEYIINSLKWCGLTIDEGVGVGGNCGPYRQSERREIYKKYVKELLEAGKAYVAFDTPAELEDRHKDVPNFQYDASTRNSMRNSLTIPAAEVEKMIAAGEPYVVRFKIEPNEDVKVNDLIRGEVIINSTVLDDKVLYKSSDELPTYHLANIVDDHLMRITHVIRGEEWLPSAPLHVLLYRAFEWKAPEFAHLPLILKPVGNGKLSKRDGNKMGFPVFPLEYTEPETGEVWHGYREDGYFPEAFINMLALLGWNAGDDKEIYTMDELFKAFSLERVHKSGSRFDPEKAKWFNHYYLGQKSNAELAELLKPMFDAVGIAYTQFKLETVCGLMKERATFVKDLFEEILFFFVTPETYVEKDVKKFWKEGAADLMRELLDIIKGIEDFTVPTIEKTINEWIAAKELGFGKVMNPFRVSVVGAAKGPHMYDIVAVLGKEETVKRMEQALVKI